VCKFVADLCYNIRIAQGSHVWMRPRMNGYVVTSIESPKKVSWIQDNVSANHEVGRSEVTGG
jgi:hypothetical protein